MSLYHEPAQTFPGSRVAMPPGPRVPEATTQPVGPGSISRGDLGHKTNPQTTHEEGKPRASGINAALEDRFHSLREAIRSQGGDIYIFSGERQPEDQQRLFDQAVAKYGDPKEAAKRVKPPGKSSHDPTYGINLGFGPGALGVDIRGDLAIAHKLGPHFGLVFPSTTQPWHMEFAGLDKVKT